MPLGADHLLYITTEPEPNHTKVINGIKTLQIG